MAEVARFLEVPAEHPIFAGHFPGRPIVPGVMLLEWVLNELGAKLGQAPSRLRIRESKFFAPLAPGERAQLSFRPGESITRCTFEIRRDSMPVARGVVEWDAYA
jgi:3-hydroxyacyl-[acyl-carrier-protein] dehydratase